MSNTSICTTQRRRNEILEEYFESLKKSGYSWSDIEKYCTPGIVGYERRVKREGEGGTPIHRIGATIRKGTDLKKLTIKTDWYTKKTENNGMKYKISKWGNKKISNDKIGCSRDPPSAPLFVPRTPGGALATRLKKIETSLNQVGIKKIKIIEEGGTTLESLLIKKSPMKEKLCERSNCQICNFEGSKGKCALRGVTYTDTCLECERMGYNAKYYGETSASTHWRALQHISDADRELT